MNGLMPDRASVFAQHSKARDCSEVERLDPKTLSETAPRSTTKDNMAGCCWPVRLGEIETTWFRHRLRNPY